MCERKHWGEREAEEIGGERGGEIGAREENRRKKLKEKRERRRERERRRGKRDERGGEMREGRVNKPALAICSLERLALGAFGFISLIFDYFQSREVHDVTRQLKEARAQQYI